MMLESAIANITSNLDVICQRGGKSISSHEKLKEKALGCLVSLIKSAPSSEYKNLISSKDSEILLGYLLSVLCKLIKDDKSRSIKLQSLETVETLIDQLSIHHRGIGVCHNGCSIIPLAMALPGVSSVLFQLVMSDTKLPKNLTIKSIQVLCKLIVATLSDCDHKTNSAQSKENSSTGHLEGQDLTDTCNNLFVRMSFLLNYITSNASMLHLDIRIAALDTCMSILRDTPIFLVSKMMKSILRYMAFMSSSLRDSIGDKAVIQLKLMLMTDEIRFKLLNCDKESDKLDTVILTCLFNILDNLEENCLTMLIGERQSELGMLSGLIQLLPPNIMTTLLETPEKKDTLFNILLKLTEFSNDQPLLFLTDSHIDGDAVQQINAKRIYTIEKRFLHLNEWEIEIVNTCCQMIGQNTDWQLLTDILRNDLSQFSNASNLYITLEIIKGCSSRSDLDNIGISRFLKQTLQRYRDAICERLSSKMRGQELIYTCDIMVMVISIETIVALIETYSRATQDPLQSLILKDILCPILNWCACSSRAVSEASLSALSQISTLYGFNSTSSLIEQNTDYIVNGIAGMLENFACNPEVADVLAIAFRLSSIKTFYYFRDIYERVFKALAKYHQTRSSIPLTLLLYRTVSIINDWKASTSPLRCDGPLKEPSTRQTTMNELDIDKIILDLVARKKKVERINNQIDSIKTTSEQEQATIKEIESGKINMEDSAAVDTRDTDEEAPNIKRDCRDQEVILTEKILKHCIGLMSSSQAETRILALKTATCGLTVLRDEENTLLPLVHQLWAPLGNRLNQNYVANLEENLCAFECLISMAMHSKDFIKRRTLDTIIPRICLFLETQAPHSRGKREYEPYCMTIQYKCQLRILSHLGQLAYHTQIAYTSLWRIITVALKYLEISQVPSLREASLTTLEYLSALDADCVWFFAKQYGKLGEIHALKLLFELS